MNNYTTVKKEMFGLWVTITNDEVLYKGLCNGYRENKMLLIIYEAEGAYSHTSLPESMVDSPEIMRSIIMMLWDLYVKIKHPFPFPDKLKP